VHLRHQAREPGKAGVQELHPQHAPCSVPRRQLWAGCAPSAAAGAAVAAAGAAVAAVAAVAAAVWTQLPEGQPDDDAVRCCEVRPLLAEW